MADPKKPNTKSKKEPGDTNETKTDATENMASGGESQGVTKEEAMSRGRGTPTKDPTPEDGGDETPKLENLMDDLDKFLEEHGMRKATIVGPFLDGMVFGQFGGPCPRADTCANAENCPISGRDSDEASGEETEEGPVPMFYENDVIGVLNRIADNLARINETVIVSRNRPMNGKIGSISDAPVFSAKLKKCKHTLTKKDYKRLKKMMKRVSKKERAKIIDSMMDYLDSTEEEITSRLENIEDQMGTLFDRLCDERACQRWHEQLNDLPRPDWTIEDWVAFQNRITQHVLSSKCRCGGCDER